MIMWFSLVYLAVGKRRLAKCLCYTNRKFIDLDSYIEKKENKSLTQIFKSHGESSSKN